jgi:hypothetical protein
MTRRGATYHNVINESLTYVVLQFIAKLVKLPSSKYYNFEINLIDYARLGVRYAGMKT